MISGGNPLFLTDHLADVESHLQHPETPHRIGNALHPDPIHPAEDVPGERHDRCYLRRDAQERLHGPLYRGAVGVGHLLALRQGTEERGLGPRVPALPGPGGGVADEREAGHRTGVQVADVQRA